MDRPRCWRGPALLELCPDWARRQYARMDRSLITRRKRRNAMCDGKKIRRDACSAVGTVRARIPHALPTMLALRRGSRRLELVAQQRGTLKLLTKWPEGRRRGRAGGRQEYRHFSSLAQPSPSASASLGIAAPRRHSSAKFVPSPYFTRDGFFCYTPLAVLRSIPRARVAR